MSVQKFGRFLSSMVMPNIGAFIAWGLITALFIDTGWFPNELLAGIVGPMLTYMLPLLVGYTGGKVVGGDRGGVIGAIATIGVICGSDTTMLIGAMVMGPLAGFIIKSFDKAMEGNMPAGFEMLINNFSVGIFGTIISIFAFYAVSPVITSILAFLSGGVAVIMEKGLLPLVAIFIEPAKVLFLNNAINHGVLAPIGIEQVLASDNGTSIMYMIEANPGPGLGVLLAYCLFAKGDAKSSAPGAVIIHFLGGIHEIYFPFILMNPLVILAPIAGSAAAIFFYSMMGAGLFAAPAPGSIIAFMALAPQGQTLTAIAGILIAAAVSFVVASPIVKMGSKNDDGSSLADAQSKMSSMKMTTKGEDINKIVFSCDAGMGSSAMGATKFRNRLKTINPNIIVINTSVDTVPPDADVVVCQVTLKDRAKKSAPQAQLITIGNFLADPNLDMLEQVIRESVEKTGGAPAPAEAPAEAPAKPSGGGATDIIIADGVMLGQGSITKEQAIQQAGELLCKLGYTQEGYTAAMLDREKLVTTYIGEGVAIPHGTSDGKAFVQKTGIVFLQFPEGIDFGDEKAYLVFGIAGLGDEHLELLGNIAEMIDVEEDYNTLKNTANKDDVLRILTK